MCHFLTGPCGALNTRPWQRVLREPYRGPHHIQFVKEPPVGTFRETHRAARLSHTPQKCPLPHHHHPTVSTVYFSTVAPGLLSGDLTFDSSAWLQVARRRGLLRVCELFRCPSLAVFCQKPQGKEKFSRRRTAAGWSCHTHHFRRVLVSSLSLSPQFELDKLEY